MNQEFAKVVEVVIPDGEQADAHIRQVVALADSIGAAALIKSEALVTPLGLEEASRDLWQSPVYGRVALGLLNELRASIQRGGVKEERNKMLNLTILALGLTGRMATVGVATTPLDEARQNANEILQGVPSPFPLQLIPGSNRPERELDLAVLSPTKNGTAGYLAHNNIDRHTLHGLIGKSLDTLMGVAGLPLAEDYRSHHWKGPFISTTALSKQLTDVGATKSQKATLMSKMSLAQGKQGRYGYTEDFGEVIVEAGRPKPQSPHGLVWDCVAIASLTNLANSYKAGSQMQEFLLELAGQNT